MTVLLHNKELWEKFSEHQTEMIITKEGRRMCPAISLAFKDLNPRQMYAVMIDFAYADEFRYVFDMSTNRWAPWRPIKQEDDFPRMYLHPETPTTGDLLMKSVLTFKRLKLTNSSQTASKTIQVFLLNTMRRYVPRIHLLPSPDGANFDYKIRNEFCFPETEFIAVSAYRNKQITKLKIDANPFASAYRNSGLHGQAKRVYLNRNPRKATYGCDARKADKNLGIRPSELPAMRRMEFMEARARFHDDSASNSSNLEESLSDNREDLEFGTDSSTNSNDHTKKQATEQVYNEEQLNGMQAMLPFLKDRLRRDVSFYVYNPINNETYRQEKVVDSIPPTNNQPTNQLIPAGESESQLACQETREWMWGFDEQLSLRYSPEFSELKDFLPVQVDDHGNETKTSNDTRNHGIQVNSRSNLSDTAKGVVNRRKKYLPRKLQRTDRLSVTDINLKTGEETSEIQQDKPNSNQDNVPLSASQVNECYWKDKSEVSSYSDVGTPQESPDATTSSCVEAEKAPHFQDVDQDSLLLRSRIAVDVPVTSQENSCPPAKESGVESRDSVQVPPKESGAVTSSVESISSLLPSSRPENTADSSLNALIQMCREDPKAEGTLSDRSYLPRSTRKGELLSTLSSSSSLSVPQVSLWPSKISSLNPTTSQGEQRNKFPGNSSDGGLATPSSAAYNISVATVVPEGDAGAHSPLLPPATAISSFSCENLTSVSSNNITSSPVTVATSAAVDSSDKISLKRFILDKDTMVTTNRSQTNLTEPIREKSGLENPLLVGPIPVHASETNDEKPPANKHSGYRLIVPAPNQTGEAIIRKPAIDASKDSGYVSDNTIYPIIVDTFSISENIQSGLQQQGFFRERPPNSHFLPSQHLHPSPVNLADYSTANPYQTSQTGYSGFIALDSTVAVQALSLEKFYSFSLPNKHEHETPRSRLHGTRHYKTTRTNFSRLSLEPLCSVIYPLTSATVQPVNASIG